jgi:hypothetical protein
LSVAVALAGVIMIAGLFKLHTRRAPVSNLKVAGTPEQIQRGQAISDGFCSACHSKTGTLTGDLDIGEDFPVPVGRSCPLWSGAGGKATVPSIESDLFNPSIPKARRAKDGGFDAVVPRGSIVADRLTGDGSDAKSPREQRHLASHYQR